MCCNIGLKLISVLIDSLNLKNNKHRGVIILADVSIDVVPGVNTKQSVVNATQKIALPKKTAKTFSRMPQQ